jgi:hypothetical protein
MAGALSQAVEVGVLAAAYGNAVAPSLLTGEGGYLVEDGSWVGAVRGALIRPGRKAQAHGQVRTQFFVGLLMVEVQAMATIGTVTGAAGAGVGVAAAPAAPAAVGQVVQLPIAVGSWPPAPRLIMN